MEAAINDDANIPQFVKQFNPLFPVGTANHLAAREFLRMDSTTRAYVPFVVFIDRKGMIRAQFTGTDKELSEDQQDKPLRALAQKLLNEPGAVRAKPKPAAR